MVGSNNDGVSLWQDEANCKGVNSTVFFGEEGSTPGKGYKTFCNQCPVKAECLEYALLYDMSGVWGGMTEKERKRKISKTRIAMLRDDCMESGLYNPALKV